MAQLEIKRGLDIPMAGGPQGEVQALVKPGQVALDLTGFDDTKFKLNVSLGDTVQRGQAIAEDKNCAGRMFVSPGAGKLSEVRRGLKRRLLYLVIDLSAEESVFNHGTLDAKSASREELVEKFKQAGIFSRIRRRPFNLLAHPDQTPRSIFVKAVESAPFVPPAEMQVQGYEKEFQEGLYALAKLTSGDVHLVHHKDSSCAAFTEAQGVKRHTVVGPHPMSNSSVHIHHIDPVKNVEDVVWTVHAHDVVCMGSVLLKGQTHVERVISMAGNGMIERFRGYFRTREGYPIGGLVANRNARGLNRFISGDPLTGLQVNEKDFLGLHHFCFTMLPENTSREFIHFFRPGLHKFTASRTYLSGYLQGSGKQYSFSTNQHGEERAFVDGSIYEKVMPMRVPTMELVKAVIGEDFDAAEELGFLEVAGEDFALPTFVCPCKVEMQQIMGDALKAYSKDVLE